MHFEIMNTPIHFRLHGHSSAVERENYGEVGFRLMNEMWKVVKSNGVETTGINHWVYLADGSMFVGVEIKNTVASDIPASLELLAIDLRRYLRHVHVGPYQLLPQKWKALKTELAACGEIIGTHSLEIYGHHTDDPSKTETTILIGLAEKSV